MKTIRIKNLRNIKDSGDLVLRPITIFVGANSSGKSTCLRTFPMLKQTLWEPKHGPILWYHEKGVDFGDFQSAVRCGHKEISLAFDVKIGFAYFSEFAENLTVNLEIVIASYSKMYDYLSEITLNYKDNQVNIKIEHSGRANVVINGTNVGILNFDLRRVSFFFPKCYSNNKPSESLMSLFKKIKGIRRIDDISDFLFASYEDFKGHFEEENEFVNLYNELILLGLPSMLEMIEINMKSELMGVSYIGPFREAPQRYYRHQNSTTEEMDQRGSNLPTILGEMSSKRLGEINVNLLRRFGFELAVKKRFGHVSIYINKNEVKTNLIDNGFGYSQILPILLALYLPIPSNRWNRSMESLLCIEQPELHLHPRMQYLLGKSIVDVVLDGKKGDVFEKMILLETHSRSIIDAIGESISNREIDRENVAVYLFGTNDERDVVEARFDSEGYLKNWPLGFLD